MVEKKYNFLIYDSKYFTIKKTISIFQIFCLYQEIILSQIILRRYVTVYFIFNLCLFSFIWNHFIVNVYYFCVKVRLFYKFNISVYNISVSYSFSFCYFFIKHFTKSSGVVIYLSWLWILSSISLVFVL